MDGWNFMCLLFSHWQPLEGILGLCTSICYPVPLKMTCSLFSHLQLLKGTSATCTPEQHLCRFFSSLCFFFFLAGATYSPEIIVNGWFEWLSCARLPYGEVTHCAGWQKHPPGHYAKNRYSTSVFAQPTGMISSPMTTSKKQKWDDTAGLNVYR